MNAMPVSLSAVLPNSKAETTAKPADPGSAKPAGSFSDQMGRIMDRDGEARESGAAGKPAEQASEAAGNESATQPDAAARPPRAAKAAPAQNPALPAAPAETCADAAAAADAQTLAGMMREMFKKLPAPAGKKADPSDPEKKSEDAEKSPAASASSQLPVYLIQCTTDTAAQISATGCQKPDAADGTIAAKLSELVGAEKSAGNRQTIDAARQVVETQPVFQEALAGLKTELPKAAEDVPGKSANLDSLAKTAVKDAAEKPDIAQQSPAIGSAAQKTGQSKSEITAKDAPASSAPQAETPQSAPSQPDWNPSKEKLVVAQQPASSGDSETAENAAARPAAAPKPETIVASASENRNAGGADANKDQPGRETFSRPALPGKSENAQAPVSGKLQPAGSGRALETQTTLTSSDVRMAETAHAAGSPVESAAKSQPRDFISQLADQIQVQVREGKEEIRIQLKPDSLGYIEIKAETTVNGVTARITAESASVKSYLENNLHVLQQALSDQGLRMDRIQIAAQDSFDAQFASGYNTHFGNAGSRRNGKNSSGAAESSGPLAIDASEEIAADPLAWRASNPNGRFYTVA